ncbi:MAG: prephenate dehydrogenase/arogenate dehydrogenase family protein [Caldisericia bacterium]|nr:prephenate dehydrogenase/arogenate dehydrogenase family protein [Caldisericia bacterium]
MNSLFIVGLGLIGGSIGLKLKDKWLRFGFDIDKEIEKRAIEKEAVDEILNLDDGLKKDLILISLPVQFIKEFLRENKDKFGKESVVIDTGSTKREVIHEMKNLNCFYIGGHPIAGKEKSGIENIEKDLFKDKLFILTYENNLNEEKLNLVKKFIYDLESKFIFLNAEEHDYIFGLLSHFPYLISVSLFYFIYKKEGLDIFKFAGTGIRDLTRIASGDVLMSYGFIKTNKDFVKKFLSSYIKELENLYERLEKDEIFEILKETKEGRDKIW